MLPVSRALSSIALRVSRSPIESIVSVFVLTTLAYFHVLAAVKQSNFLQPGPAIPDAQQPALALRRSVSPEWISLSVDAPYVPRLELLPVVLPPQVPDREDALLRFLTSELTTQHGQKYAQLCFSINASCVTTVSQNSLTLAFSPGATGQYLRALTASVLPPAEDGTHLKVVQSVETIMDMRSGRWIAYAGRALVVRFWNLTKVSIIAIAPAPESVY
jgi:hydroxymethylglutaryl-CoA reductase (NADPH)